MSDLEQAIRERAYQIWMESGGADGHAERHWLEAQREVLSASLAAVARVSKAGAEKPKAKPAAAQKKRRAAGRSRPLGRDTRAREAIGRHARLSLPRISGARRRRALTSCVPATRSCVAAKASRGACRTSDQLLV